MILRINWSNMENENIINGNISEINIKAINIRLLSLRILASKLVTKLTHLYSEFASHVNIMFTKLVFGVRNTSEVLKLNMPAGLKKIQSDFTLAAKSERGDVPGWVLVVLMTTGLVTGIWTVAQPRLSSILKNSLDNMNSIR